MYNQLSTMSVRPREAFEAGKSFSLRDVVASKLTTPTAPTGPTLPINQASTATTNIKFSLGALKTAPAQPTPEPIKKNVSSFFSMRSQKPAPANEKDQASILRLTAYTDELNAKLQKTHQRLEVTEMRLARTSQALLGERQSALNRITSLKQDLAAARETEAKLKADLNERPVKAPVDDNKFSQNVEAILVEEEKLEKQKRAVAELLNQVVQLENTKASLETTIEDMTNLRKKTKEKIHALEQKHAATASSVDAITDELKEQELQLDKAKQEVEHMRSQAAIEAFVKKTNKKDEEDEEEGCGCGTGAQADQPKDLLNFMEDVGACGKPHDDSDDEDEKSVNATPVANSAAPEETVITFDRVEDEPVIKMEPIAAAPAKSKESADESDDERITPVKLRKTPYHNKMHTCAPKITGEISTICPSTIMRQCTGMAHRNIFSNRSLMEDLDTNIAGGVLWQKDDDDEDPAEAMIAAVVFDLKSAFADIVEREAPPVTASV